jgi:hypothetical protein
MPVSFNPVLRVLHVQGMGSEVDETGRAISSMVHAYPVCDSQELVHEIDTARKVKGSTEPVAEK